MLPIYVEGGKLEPGGNVEELDGEEDLGVAGQVEACPSCLLSLNNGGRREDERRPLSDLEQDPRGSRCPA